MFAGTQHAKCFCVARYSYTLLQVIYPDQTNTVRDQTNTQRLDYYQSLFFYH